MHLKPYLLPDCTNFEQARMAIIRKICSSVFSKKMLSISPTAENRVSIEKKIESNEELRVGRGRFVFKKNKHIVVHSNNAIEVFNNST